MQKKAKSAPPKKAKKQAVKAVKSSARKATKGVVKKKTKAAAVAPAKKAVKKKAAAKKIIQSAAPVNVKKAAKGKTKNAKVQPIATPKITHGKDQHFIPTHGNQLPVTIRNSKKEEQLFKHNEEVAIHQENQEVKAGMASRMGRKRIFRIPGKG